MRSCPKCGATYLWMEYENGMHHIRCNCGLCIPIIQKAEGGMQIKRTLQPKLMLPARGSKLAKCLRVLRDLEKATSGELAARLNQTVVYTSTQLCTLEGRGLLTRLDRKKGSRGGSTWMLTEVAVSALLGD